MNCRCWKTNKNNIFLISVERNQVNVSDHWPLHSRESSKFKGEEQKREDAWCGEDYNTKCHKGKRMSNETWHFRRKREVLLHTKWICFALAACGLTNRLRVECCHDLWTSHGLEPVLQRLQMNAFLGVIRRVHQHCQTVLHTGQLGWDGLNVLQDQMFPSNRWRGLLLTRSPLHLIKPSTPEHARQVNV